MRDGSTLVQAQIIHAGSRKVLLLVLPDTPSVSQLSRVISQAAAPAFLLGALAALYCRPDFAPEQDRRSNDRPERDFRRRYR
jgi:hypothetical protein